MHRNPVALEPRHAVTTPIAPAAANEITTLAVNTMKFLAIDAIEAAKSGHPGLPMGAADVAYVLWARYLRHDPKNPHWRDRDRFILSPGHGSMLLYGLLHLAGYDLPLDELKHFRQWDSKTPGHPEVHLTPGVEVTTGPLGQGFANGVGMALAAKMAQARLPGLFDHHIWALVSDGDVMEGVSYEAASIAGHLKLGNLTYIYDANNITLDGRLDEAFDEDVAKRFEAAGWRTETIDGHDHAQIAAAYDAALAQSEKPTLIIARTHIGHGAPNKHDTHKVHGEPLGKDEALATRKALGWPEETFVVPGAVRAHFADRAKVMADARAQWEGHEQAWLAAHPELADLYRKLCDRTAPDDLLETLLAKLPPTNDATRALAGTIEQMVAAAMPSLVGGDADLGGSTKTPIKDSAKVTAADFTGRNLRFGIREHAMGSIANGISLYGLFVPFTATFLTFSDYMRPPIRLAGLSNVPVVHVFTHDSVFLGEDGPTHQSVEHVSALRLIPNVDVWRPADSAECAAAWAAAATRRDGPTELVLSRQKVEVLPGDPTGRGRAAARGGYVLVREEGGDAQVVILSTGSEVSVAVEAARRLHAEDGRRVRVVSMPCLEVFARQDPSYREEVLGPAGARRASFEAGRTGLWWRYLGLDGLALGVDTFGASAPGPVLGDKYGLTADHVTANLRKWLRGS
ncbi:MAG: transketolase [Myxococcaceae bacterium]|nr:transketolase [Myxococcaceae bacterium]